MPAGEKAIARGMDVVHPTDDRRDGYDEINKTRDYITTQAVQNQSVGTNLIGIRWEGNRVIVRVDTSDVVAVPRISYGWGDPAGGQSGDIYFKLV